MSRAAELSTTQSGGETSLEELEKIASEAGLDKALVRQAAAELLSGRKPVRPSPLSRLFGPLSLRFETVLPGALEQEAHGLLLDAIARELGLPGQLSQAGRSFSWSINDQARSLNVHVSTRSGQTVVRIHERLGSLAGGIWGGVLGGGGGTLVPLAAIGAGALVGGPMAVTAAVALSLGASVFGTRALYRHAVRRRERALSSLFDELCTIVGEHAAPAPDEASEGLAKARVRHGLAAAPDPARPAPADVTTTPAPGASDTHDEDAEHDVTTGEAAREREDRG